jgi:ethanolamine ammonia-lyase small subunit
MNRIPAVPADPRPDLPSPSTALETVRARTPARILAGRAGGSYRTSTLLELRRDHAAARDAVGAEFDLISDLGAELVERFGLFEVATKAVTKQEYLVRPDLGRALADEAKDAIARECPREADLQVVIGDGLSAAAVRAQVPSVLPLLEQESERRGWRFGRPFFVRHCRVGVLNDVGEVLGPAVVVLLIGERPGLATAESLSAYLAYRPRAGHDDSRRNLISNIHARGVPPDRAAPRIAELAAQMIALGISGVEVKEGPVGIAESRTGPADVASPGGAIQP